MEPSAQSADLEKISNPMLILHRQLKDKALKKSALQSLSTISLALGRKKTREQLIPYLGSIFVQQTAEIQKLILKGLTQLLHPIYIGKSHHSRIILELIMDILCVYSNKQIRDEAYVCLEKVFAFIDVRKAQNMLVEALIRLNTEQEEGNIRQLVLKMIPYVYAGADGDRQKQLLQILNGFKTKSSDKKLLSQMLTEFIKVMPPVPEAEIKDIISLLIKTGDKTILSNLIEPVILLTKVTDENTTEGYLKQILEQGQPTVICTALKRYWVLSSIFKAQNLKVLTDRISNYDSQPQQIKNTILELLDTLPIQQQNMIKITEPPTSLQLKTTLSQTLCRVNDLKGLLKLFRSSESHFQIKLFPKLPPISQMHVEVVDKIMRLESWRQKITILQNIDGRTEKRQATDLLLPKLTEFMGDKIACVRVAVGQTIKKIMIKHQIPISKVEQFLYKSLASKNWFERQTVYKMLLDLIKISPFHMQEKQKVLKIAKMGQQQKVDNIRFIAEYLLKHLQQNQ